MPEKLKILVVDDNEEFCRNMADILELQAHQVVTVQDGFNALETVAHTGFDLALMDVRMPVMDGVETFKRMKEIAPQTPVVMVTAFAVEELVREALREGAFGALRKPLDFDSLFQVIEQAVSDGLRVLVVDDDRELCANMQDVLKDRGYRVSVAYDGIMAVERARENRFDVMLVDLKLPARNGLETHLAIRDIRPDVTTIVITGYPRELDGRAQMALEKGVYACLEKPLNMDEVVMLLQRIEGQRGTGTLK